MKRVVLEGCNSDWARRRYLRPLIRAAIQDRIELIAVDVIPESSIIPVKKWQSARTKDKIHYFDKNIDREKYQAIDNVHRVFIVTPDSTHCKIADFWLSRLAPVGQIFIEKPLDASVKAAAALGRKRGTGSSVYAFDHYLARATPFLNNKAKYLMEIGDIKKLECRVIETHPIRPEREKTLKNGIVLDLLPHALSMVVATITSLTADSIKNIVPISFDFARYADSPVPGETFTSLKVRVDGIPVSIYIGYCISARKNKSMTIHGIKGKIELNLADDTFITPSNNKSDELKLQQLHVESFIESVLKKDTPPTPEIGVMEFDTSYEILKFIDRYRKGISKRLPEYPCMSSIDKIMKILKRIAG